MRHLRPVAVILLLCLFTASAAKAQVPIRGTLLGADGQPMQKAHIVVEDGPADVRIIAEADGDGRFSFELPEPGGYGMYLMGVHHATLEAPLVVTGAEPVELTARLATPAYKNPPEAVRVIGAFDDFEEEKERAVLMEEQTDGTFAAQVEATADTMAYQISGVLGRGTLGGAQASRYVFNRNGPFWDDRSDYAAVIDDSEGTVRVMLDPSALPQSAGEAVVRSTDATVEGIISIYRDVEGMEQRMGQQAKSSRMLLENAASEKERKAIMDSLQGVMRTFSAEMQQPVRQRLDTEADSLLRQWLLLRYFDELRPSPDDSLLARRVLDEVPPTSPFWSYEAWSHTGASNLVSSLSRSLGGPDAVLPYVRRVIETHPDSDVRRQFLFAGTFMADREGREEEKMEYYGRLVSEFGDSWHAERARREFAPKRTIQVGKPIPDFALPAMGDTSTVYSSENLRGVPYLIDVWAVWCAPCIAEMDELHAAYEKYQDDGLRIVSISFDYERQEVQAFRAERWPMPWKHVFAGFGTEAQREIESTFEVAGIPRTILVDKSGAIIATGGALRGEKLEQTLARVFDSK